MVEATALPKRFYKEAWAVEDEAGGFGVRLDQRVLKSPAGAPFRLPTLGLAEAIAEEWHQQGDRVRPLTMPLMTLAATAIDKILPDRAPLVAALANYAETDLLCYRATAPQSLVRRQQEQWQPILDWAHSALDADLAVTSGVLPLQQSPAALKAVRLAVEAVEGFALAALQSVAEAAGSILLALAMARGRLDDRQVFELSQLDESFQIENWGEDAEQSRRRAALGRDMADAQRFLRLLGRN